VTVISKVSNAAVYLGLPFTQLEFENPLAGTETVLSYPVLDWRDADYAAGPPPWYDDWNVFLNGSFIDGNANEIWMRARGQFIWTTTLVPSEIVSIHLVGDSNDGMADVLVDGIVVAQLDMFTPSLQPGTALIIVRGLSRTVHTIQVNATGPGQGTSSDVATLGTAALDEAKVKWEQPPAPGTDVFYGWNEISMYEIGPIAADDWVCTTTNPVTDIHWWGSFVDWREPVPPNLPNAFQIAFWTDVPTNAAGDFSHPGMVLKTIWCTNYTWKFVGWDYDPIKQTYEACFRFDQDFLPEEYFYQGEDPGATGTNIYWVSIAAAYQTMPPNPWGWKTRPRDPASPAPDDAVRIDMPTALQEGMVYEAGNPIWWPTEAESWDLAFELTSKVTSEVTKWEQVPDLSDNGMDVNATWLQNVQLPPPPQPYLLADDFLCTSPGPITNITIWGSWTNDFDWQNVIFTLSIHEDIPSNSPPYYLPYSMPGTNVWVRPFMPGEYGAIPIALDINEWFFTPPTDAVFPGDHVCWQYDFNIPIQEAFRQEGTPQTNKVYWLDVQAQIPDPLMMPPYPVWGWKTCPTNWNDDAAWVNATEPYNGIWNRLTYPPQHPFAERTVDMAFRLQQDTSEQEISEIKWSQPPVPATDHAFNGWNEYSVYGDAAGGPPQIVADDWVCTNVNPVTDIHWWGSFIGWSEPWLEAGMLPDAFNITIWTDVPADPTGLEPFSHPSNCVWQIICTNFTWQLAGYDVDPRDPNAPLETCFKFEQDLLETEYFRQNPDGLTNIYWISIAAVYSAGQVPQFPWGWKTRPRDTNSLAPDDAVRIFQPTDPVPGMTYVAGEPIEYPAGESWDMAFVLTTKEEATPTDDFGDAPEGTVAPLYPTKLVNNGARHTVVAGVFMGNLIDAELDGQPNATATGDDLAGLADEDGVVLISVLVPGETSTVRVTASVSGFLSAWLDYNADGSWATPGDQIFNNVPVNPGANILNFNVPFSAAQGSNTFARFRFCTVSNAVTSFTGPAPDGEVEDYRWYIEQLDFGDAQEPTFPTTYASNGARHQLTPTIFLGALIDSEADGQPNATATGDDIAGSADEDGVTLLTPLVAGQPAQLQVFATMGGGLLNAPLNAWIDFDADGSWATPGDQICVNTVMVPGVNLVNFNVPPTAAAGSTVFARFRFSTMSSPPLTYAGFAPNGEVEDYLWKIEQLDFGDAPDPVYPTFLANSGAHHLVGRLFMGATVDGEADGQPNAFATGDDLAGLADEDGVVFTSALISGVPATVQVTCSGPGLLQGWIDWNQDGSWAGEQIIANVPVVAGANTVSFSVPNGVPSGKTFARFRLSTVAGLTDTGYAPDGEVEDYEVILYPLKWLQVPEQGPEGADVSLARPLADDFICSESGPITDVHIWGSFLRDVLPVGGPTNMTLTLTIYADVPAPVPSHPGQVLWSQTFNPGQYQAANNFTAVEWWHDPSTQPPTWVNPGDTNMYQFDFYIDPADAFRQVEGTIYWLGVSIAPGPANFSFGWKTTPVGYAPDAACWLDSGGIWHPLAHLSGRSMDLAFALSGAESLYDADFGDAPSPYPTLSASGGAQHWAVPGFCLGQLEDTEADGIPHPQALGDDLNNLADEDGVVFKLPVLAGTQACVNVTLTGPVGLLDAWVDFNKNGAWDHPSEQIFASQALASGANLLCFNVPTNAVLGTNFARFRLSSAGGLTPTGIGPDGEVEDYQLVIQQRRPLTNIVITNIWATNINANTQVVNLAWTYENGVHYQVRYAPNLQSNYVSNIFWIDLGPEIIGPAHQYQDTISPVGTQRYYRVVAPYLYP